MKDVFLFRNQWSSAEFLHSQKSYRTWFLKFHGENLRMFSRENITALLEEIEPNYYPCYGLFQDEPFDVIYLSPDLVHYLAGKFGDSNN